DPTDHLYNPYYDGRNLEAWSSLGGISLAFAAAGVDVGGINRLRCYSDTLIGEIYFPAYYNDTLGGRILAEESCYKMYIDPYTSSSPYPKVPSTPVIYPNPVTASLNVYVGFVPPSDTVSIDILDMAGASVYSCAGPADGDYRVVDVSALANGTYLAKLSTNG